MLLRLAKVTDDADYDANKTSGNVPRPRSDFGNDHGYNGLRTRCPGSRRLLNVFVESPSMLWQYAKLSLTRSSSNLLFIKFL
ncbi:unnamed protein product [Protopolystoma xenopodis]|uniref:Uncharacterized protein n=1 Tax=Protopolystoma xenopodis TaxID=117903 RepID=A0A448XGD0_9PLAT|nr:unnamed protein product [Protopolystoma xenopodis]